MNRIALWVALSIAAAPAAGQSHDDFHHLGEINKASLVMLVEEGFITRSLGADIAGGVARVIDEQGAPGEARSSNYLDFEARLFFYHIRCTPEMAGYATMPSEG